MKLLKSWTNNPGKVTRILNPNFLAIASDYGAILNVGEIKRRWVNSMQFPNSGYPIASRFTTFSSINDAWR